MEQPIFCLVPFPSVSDLVPYPDSNRSVEPDPESGSGSRRAKMSNKSRKNLEI
jgi:hypothetical protein